VVFRRSLIGSSSEPTSLPGRLSRRHPGVADGSLTSNGAIEEWHPLLGDALLASAAMDRLLHHAHVVVMDDDTYRNPPPARRARRGHGRAQGG
jgi:hypothetical protein